MKIFLFFISLLSLTICFGQTKNSIKILDCETGLIYQYSDNKFELKGTWYVPNDSSKIWYSKTVDKETRTSFDKLFDAFSKLDKKVFYYNNCVDDGFHFKVYIQTDTSIQKIFVGNYYDKLIDRLTTLIQAQLTDFKPDFIVRISYGNDKTNIENMIKSQTTCNYKYSDDTKKHLLDNWCELEEKK